MTSIRCRPDARARATDGSFAASPAAFSFASRYASPTCRNSAPICAFTPSSRMTSHRHAWVLPGEGAWSASRRQSARTPSSTGRSRSSLSRTARVVLSKWSTSMSILPPSGLPSTSDSSGAVRECHIHGLYVPQCGIHGLGDRVAASAAELADGLVVDPGGRLARGVAAADALEVGVEVVVDRLARGLVEAALLLVVAVAEVVAVATGQEVEPERLVGGVGTAIG